MNTTQVRARRARRWSPPAFAAVLVAGALLPAAASAQSPNYEFYFDQVSDGTSYVIAISDQSTPSDQHTYSVRVTRGSTVLGTSSGTRFGGDDLHLLSPLQAGDVGTLLVDGQPLSSRTYDGNPTYGADLCAGATTFTGTITPGSIVDTAASWSTHTYGPEDPVDVRVSGGTYVAFPAHPLVEGNDMVLGTTQIVGDAQVDETRDAVIGPCGAPTVGQTPAPIIPTTSSGTTAVTSAQILAALRVILRHTGARLAKLDLRTLAAHGFPPITFGFPTGGTTTFKLTVPGAHAHAGSATAAKKRKHRARTVTIATGAAHRATAGKAAIRLRLSKKGKALLKRSKRVRVTLTAVFNPAAGGRAQTTRTHFTLKRRAAKKHKK